MMISRFVWVFVLAGLFSCQQKALLESPDGRIKVVLGQGEQGIFYHTQYDQNTIIEPSRLGISIDGSSASQSAIYQLKSKEKLNDCNLYRYQIQSDSLIYYLQFKLFNDGIAYRYLVEKSGHVDGESSSWKIPAESEVWHFERTNHWKLKSYAGLWMKTKIDSLLTVSPTGPVQGDPLVILEPNGVYLCLAEAALYDYSGMRLRAEADRIMTVDFFEQEGFDVSKPIVTPWRVTMISQDLNGLVNNEIIESLNPAPDPQLFASADWIKPGRSVWSWWSRNDTYMSISNERKFIDYADSLGWEYALLDAGWEDWSQKWQTLAELVQYGKDHNVDLWVWKHSKEVMDADVMNSWLDSVANAGAVGVKVDFMNGESKSLIDFDVRFLEACAKRKLMVNFHGCQAPSGESVTYPNEMTREGVRGIELNIMGESLPAWHNASLPFTRYLVGHGDYTPIAFSQPGNTTWTQQLAMAYILDSPFNCMAEDPAFVYENPELRKLLPLIKSLPKSWDETIVMANSEIGKLAGFARRSGDIWYLVYVNGEDEDKSFTTNLDFLGDKKYQQLIISDETNQSFKTTESICFGNESLIIELKESGGTIAQFTPY